MSLVRLPSGESINAALVLSTRWEHSRLTYGSVRPDHHVLVIRMVDGAERRVAHNRGSRSHDAFDIERQINAGVDR